MLHGPKLRQLLLDILIKKLTSLHSKGIKCLILGVSGGADSTLTALLYRDALKELKNGMQLVGISLPTHNNSNAETASAKETLKLCNLSEELRIDNYTKLWESIDLKLKGLEEEDNFKIRLGNLQARLRMIILYDLASKYKGIVLSTDNLSEYLTGFWTLHGDVGDYGLLQNVFKTEIFNLLEFYKNNGTEQESIAANAALGLKPTDGLGISDGDEAQLGCSYSVLDKSLEKYRLTGELDDKIKDRVIKTEYKRNNPESPSRELLLKHFDYMN
jgi:nicotinamide-nucleotide amidase